MSCIQRSSWTLAKFQGCTAITVGLAIITVIPLIIGCLGKYHVLSMARPLSKAMIISGSLSTAVAVLVGVIAAIFIVRLRNQNFSIINTPMSFVNRRP